MTDVAKLARQNQEYYLSEQKTDKGNNPWFRYVKTMDSYSEVILLSPKMAQELLSADMDSAMRKPLSLHEVAGIANHMNAGKSLLDYPISISFSGKLLDGRPILQVVVDNKKSVIAHFTFNISDKLSLFF